MSAGDSDHIDTFRVRTVGLRSADLDIATVTAGLAEQFKLEPKRARAIIKGRVVAKEVSAEKARALKTKLLKIGVVAKVEKSDAELPKENDTYTPNIDRYLTGFSRHASGIDRDLRYRLLATAMIFGAIVVPALYFAMLAGLGVGMWQYAVHVPVHKSFGGILLWITPLLTGLLICVFMLRPIFVSAHRHTRMQLNQSQAPQLFELVRRISEATGTPAPEAIYVDCEANAYVTSAAGLKGYLKKRLELTIGMPLIYGMNTLQLSSVLAHEFGHFSQSFEMFTSGLVNRVNSWMGTCGWQKDPLEVRLEQWCEEGKAGFFDFAIVVALWSIRGVSWLFRKLYDLNLRLTQSLSQQMEFNADDHAVQVVGSNVFVGLSTRVRELLHGESMAWYANQGAYNENRLFENLPAAAAAYADTLTEDMKAQIQQEIEAHTTEYWSSHPADRERIDRAKAHDIADLPGGDIPATSLFADSDKLAMQVTLQTYTRDRGLKDAGQCVVGNQVILDIHKHQDDSANAIEAFLGDAYNGRICRFEEKLVNAPEMPAAPGVLANINEEKRRRLDDLFLSSIYSNAGVVFEPGTWDIDDHTADALDAEMRKCAAEQREAENKVASVDAALQHRIQTAMTTVAQHHRERATFLYGWLVQSSRWAEDVDALSRHGAVLNALLQTLSEHEAPALARTLEDYRSHAIEVVNRLCVRLGRMPNPLPDHDEANDTPELTRRDSRAKSSHSAADFLATWGVAELGKDDHASHVLDVAGNTRNGIFFLYHRVLGELSQYCVNSAAASAPPEIKAKAS